MSTTNLLLRARNVGLRAVLVPAVDHADWDELAKMTPLKGVHLYYAYGLHPFFVNKITKLKSHDLLEELQERVLNAGPKLRAVGECGLDFRPGTTPDSRDHQLDVFRAQLGLAREAGLPLTIHCVNAHGPMLELLRERPTPPSAMHAFSGSAQIAHALVAAGHYISFAGNLCVPNARKVVEAARAVPEDRLLLETDSPDQTPPARRPAANEPAFIIDIATRLAELRGVGVEAIATATRDNGRRVFGIEEPFDLHPLDDRDHDAPSE